MRRAPICVALNFKCRFTFICVGLAVSTKVISVLPCIHEYEENHAPNIPPYQLWEVSPNTASCLPVESKNNPVSRLPCVKGSLTVSTGARVGVLACRVWRCRTVESAMLGANTLQTNVPSVFTKSASSTPTSCKVVPDTVEVDVLSAVGAAGIGDALAREPVVDTPEPT